MKSKLFVLLLLIVFLVGCATEQATKVAETPTKETQTAQPPTQETKETPKEKIYSMNEDVKVDYLTYKVTKAETFTEMGTSIYNKKTNGKFVKVYLDITNNAKETKDIFTPRFKIIDSQEREFDRLSDDMLYIADYLEFGKQLQPSLTISGAVVFELPKDSEDLKLVISGDWLSTAEIKVALSNIVDIVKDNTQMEKQNEMMGELITGNVVNEDKSNEEFEFDPDSTVNTQKGISLSLDNFKYEIKGENWGKITEITITVLNEGNNKFYPKVLVQLYDEKDRKEDKFRTQAEIEFDIFGLGVGEHVTKKAVTNIGFNDLDLTKKLVLILVDAFDYNNRALVVVEKEFIAK